MRCVGLLYLYNILPRQECLLLDEQKGLPFFNLEPCIEAVKQYLEEDTRLALPESLATFNNSSHAVMEKAAKTSLYRTFNQWKSTNVSFYIGIDLGFLLLQE